MHMYAMLCSLIGELGSTSNEAIYYLDGWDNTTVCLLPFSFHCTLLLPLCNSSFTSLRVHTFHKHCCPSIEPRPVLSSSHQPRSCPFSPFCSLLSISTPFTSSSFPSFPILPLSTNHFDSCEHSCGSLWWSFPWHSSNAKIVSKTSYYSWQLHIYNLWCLESRFLSNGDSTWSNLPGNVNNECPSLGLPSCNLPSHSHCDYIHFDSTTCSKLLASCLGVETCAILLHSLWYQKAVELQIIYHWSFC